MAKKLNSMPDYQARMPKQPHDISQSYLTSMTTGQERPVYFDMLHLGDELHFNGNLFARFQPLVTAAIAKVDLHIDYFFIPLSVMYTPAPSMFYQTNDLISASFQYKDLKSFPLYDLDSSILSIVNDSAGGVNSNAKYNIGINGPQTIDMPNNLFDCRGKAAIRLLDDLQYSSYTFFRGSDTALVNPKSTPWFLCAYHACHELYYRNDDREAKRYLYNLDNYSNSTSSSFINDNLLSLHYVSAYKDYFNSVKVSPVSSSMSLLGGTAAWSLLSKVKSYLFDVGYSVTDSDGSGTYSARDAVSITSGDNSVNGANIRQLFMVDKMLRVTGRANKDYESQFLAHFGVKIPHDVMHNLTHIGHDMCTLSPEPVISSADTFSSDGGASLGEVGGQGSVSMTGKRRSFKAPCHGVFMAIAYALPRWRYYAGINKLHDLSEPMLFWQPEYDRKGMQPLFSYETDPHFGLVSSRRYGWQFAYEQFKRKYDRVSVAFASPQSYISSVVNSWTPWCLSKEPFSWPDGNHVHSSNSFNPFDEPFILLSTPHDLDKIMEMAYQSTWITDLTFANRHLLFQTDPLFVDFNFQVKKVNFMSEFGEPELD